VSAPASGARVATDPRITRRRQAVARLHWRRLVTRLACIAALGALAWVLFASPILTVRTVQVVGGRHTGPRDVAAVADLSGDENLLLLSTGEVARDTARLPWVARASVDRKLPGTIRVAIRERSPAVVLATNGERWLAGPRGHVLARGHRDALPLLADTDLGRLRPGTRVEAAEVSAALAVLRALPARLRSRVEAVFAPTRERITLSLLSTPPTPGPAPGPAPVRVLVRVGAAEALRAKASVLRALLRRMAAEQISASYVDVRVPSSPALGPVPGSAPALGEATAGTASGGREDGRSRPPASARTAANG
jgi:cell division protein FtsQ